MRPARSYCARNFASSGRPSSTEQFLDLAGAVGQRHRQHAGVAQASSSARARGDVGRLAEAAEIEDHRGAPEQLRRALHAVAHLRGQLRDVERAHAQVGDADLADLEFAGLFVIDCGVLTQQVPGGALRGRGVRAARPATGARAVASP